MGAQSRYRKVFVCIWGDEKFRSLPIEEKLVTLYVLTCEQGNRIGLFKFSTAEAAEDLGMPLETFRERFGKVCGTLNWTFDERSRVLYLPSWWKWNHPENVNVLKGAILDLDAVPETYLTKEFTSNTSHLEPNLIETFLKRSGNVTETMANPRTGTGTGTHAAGGNGQESPERKAEIAEAEKLAKARTASVNWLTAERPDLLRYSGNLTELAVWCGSLKAALEESPLTDPSKKNPFAYALARLQGNASKPAPRRKPKASTAFFREDN